MEESYHQGVRVMKFVSREDFRRAARTPGGMAGLVLLLIGILMALAGGLTLGILLDGHPSNRSTLQLFLAVQLGAAVAIGVLGNYLWYRARVATRRLR
jgi:hypothetical protein